MSLAQRGRYLGAGEVEGSRSEKANLQSQRQFHIVAQIRKNPHVGKVSPPFLYMCSNQISVRFELVHCIIDLAPGEFDGKDRHIST